MLKWHEVFSWIHKGCANTNYAQKSKLLDNRGPTLFPEKGWCFSTNHWKKWNLTFFVWISFWDLWRPLCKINHNKKYFASKLLFAHHLQGCPWLLQELWYMSNLCTKVYYEWPSTPHTTSWTFWWGIDLMEPFFATPLWGKCEVALTLLKMGLGNPPGLSKT